MPLKIKIQEDLISALKQKKEREISVLRMVNAAIINKEKEKRYEISKIKTELTEKELEKESGLTDEEGLEIISSEIKKRKEAALLFEKGKRTDLAEKEKQEIKILENYLPQQLSEKEIQKIAEEIIKKTGAKEEKDMGKVMKELMPELKGKADGNLVSKIVKDLLT